MLKKLLLTVFVKSEFRKKKLPSPSTHHQGNTLICKVEKLPLRGVSFPENCLQISRKLLISRYSLLITHEFSNVHGNVKYKYYDVKYYDWK